MTRRRSWIVVAAASSVVAATTIVVAFMASRPDTNGPLANAPAFGYSVVVPVGESVTDAFTVLQIENSPDDPIELLSIEQVYPDGRVQSAGEWIAGQDRDRGALVPEQFYRDAPPTDPRLGTLREIAGAQVSQDADGFVPQLLLATTVREDGHFLRDGLWITYQYGGRTYRDFLPSKLTICTPDAVNEDGVCPFLGEEEN